MINLKTDNRLLIAEREKAKKYLLEKVLKESPHNDDMVHDLINLTEVSFGKMEITIELIEKVYSRLYSPKLLEALPEHMLKGSASGPEFSNLKIV